MHKLYNQSCGGAVQKLFSHHFGDNRQHVCTIGVEPNPMHRKTLSDAEATYSSAGFHVRFIIGAASIEDGTQKLALGDPSHDYWKAGLSGSSNDRWDSGSIIEDNVAAVSVPTIDAGAILRGIPDRAHIVMKIDVEGHETVLLPALVQNGALCRVAEVYIETHGKEAEASLSQAQRDLQRRGCSTVLTWMDDETLCPPPDFSLRNPSIISPPFARAALLDMCMLRLFSDLHIY